jgi:ribosomal protein S18 acetylase RimI-like enzyme
VPPLTIKVLDPSIDTRNFQLDPPESARRPEDYVALRRFLRDGSAERNAQACLGSTYVSVDADTNEIAGYITVCSSQIKVPKVKKREGHLFEYFPAVKIAMLAVDDRFRGLCIGSDLVIGVAHGLGNYLAERRLCRFVWADAIHDAVGFYAKLGYEPVDESGIGKGRTTQMVFDLLPHIEEQGSHVLSTEIRRYLPPNR